MGARGMVSGAAGAGAGQELAAEDVAVFAAAITERFGHEPDERREDTLRAVLAGRMRAAGVKSFRAYRDLLERSGNGSGREWEALAPLLTVPETYFYRMPEHFDALVEEALPRLRAERRQRGAGNGGLRILSAGCATGEEAYTLRMILSERVPAQEQAAPGQVAGGQIKIDGVDLSLTALERARAGVYNEWSLRATDAGRRRRWFQPAGRQFRLNAEARVGVTFRQENLLQAPAATGPGELYDVIFCRNVLIYFTQAAMRQAIAGLAARLAPDGYLFLGPAESLRGLTREFEVCQARETFFYRHKAVVAVAHAGAGESWYEAIQSSSERLETLVAEGAPKGMRAAATPAVTPAAPGQAQEPASSLVRASLLTDLGQYAEAEAECRRLLAEDALNAGTHYLLGLCREQAGAPAEAEEQMERSLFLDPGFAMAHVHGGLLARRRGELNAASAAFGRALEALAGETEARLALFGGGFSREGLRKLCAGEMARLAGEVRA